MIWIFSYFFSYFVNKIFEVNCRFSGTTPFCAQLGFNPVEYYIKKTQGIDYHGTINFDAMVLRHWQEVVVNKSVMKQLEQTGRIEPTVLNSARLY